MVIKLVADGSGVRPLDRAALSNSLPAGAYPLKRPAEMLLVGECRETSDLGHAADAVVIADLLEIPNDACLANCITAADTGEAISLGERAHPEDVWTGDIERG